MSVPLVNVLGPVSVRDGGGSRILRGQQGALLSVLAAAHPDPVGNDSLIEALWGFHPPATATTGLRVVVGRLRERLADAGGNAISTRSGHYQLTIPGDELDRVRFADAVQQGVAARRAGELMRSITLFEDALSLWRGDAFAPFDDDERIASAARSLTEQRAAAEDLLAESLLDAGRYADALAHLSATMGDFEVRERRWELLMLALYRSGRQAEALRTYQRAARFLRDELGIEPGPALRRLERAVLDQDPTLLAQAQPPVPVADPGMALTDLVSLLRVQPAPAPVPATAFIGRDAELDQLVDVIEECRLVTVVGPPGVGKTRLAGQLARSQNDRRVLWLDLAEHRPEDMVRALADQLDVRAPDAELAEAVADALRSSPTLVVMDNCELMAELAGLFSETLVRRCPDLTVLATSRQRLGCESESPFPLGPLEPDAARRLLLERAYGVGRTASAAAASVTEPELGQLVDRLDRLPLTLELVASALRTRPPGEILQELSGSSDLLVAPGRTDGRHERWSVALDWSVDALGQDQRRAFDHLGVMAGSFTASDLVAVDGSGSADPIEGLIEHSLVHATAEPDQVAVLESIRAHARGRLARSGQLTEARTRHARHFARSLVLAETRWQGPDEPRTVVRLLAAGPNLRAAFAWSLEHGVVDAAVDLAEHIWEHALFRLEFGLSRWAEEVLDRFDQEVPRRCELLATAALGAWGDGRFDRARSLAEEAEAEADRLGERLPGRSLQAQFNVASQSGRMAEAESLLLRQLDWCRREADLRQESSVLVNAACGLAVLGDPSTAVSLAESAFARAEATANPSTLAWASYARAFAVIEIDPGAAVAEFAESARLARLVRNRFVLGVALTGAAVVHRRSGEHGAARALLAEAIELWARGRMHSQLGWAAKEAVVLLDADGQATEAARAVTGLTSGPSQLLLPADEAAFARVVARTSPIDHDTRIAAPELVQALRSGCGMGARS